MPPAKAPPPKFDQAKFQQMIEPFTVRVERIEGNRKEPIGLPTKDGYAVGGPGWTSDEVMALEQWIVKDWSGGGTYLFQITDSNNPAQTMEWTAVFNYPKRVPPQLVDTAQPIPQPIPQQPSFGGGAPWPPPPPQPWQQYGMPPAPPPPPQPTWANPYGFNPYGGYPNPYGFPPQFPPPAATAVKPKDELDALKLENEKLRLAQQEERHQTQMRQQEEQHRREMEAIRAEMRNIATATTAKPAESEELRTLRLQMEREREERQRVEREASEARHRAELEAIKAQITAKPAVDPELAAMRAKMEADERRREDDRRHEEARRQQERDTQRLQDELRAMREAPKGPDPTMMMIVEQMKQNNEAAKEAARINAERDREIARANADALRELKTQMVHPAEMFRMVRDASSGQDQIITSTVSTLNSVFNTAQQWMNSVMQQMGGQGESPVYRLLEGGMQQVETMAKRWMETRTQRDVAQANAQREHAKAAAEQAKAFSAAHMPAWQPPPPVAGAAAGTPQPQAQPRNGNGNGLNGADAKPAPKGKMRNGGKTDEEWFGPALPDVEALRQVALQYQENALAKRLGPNGHPEGLGPDQAAMFIVQAAHTIAEQKIDGVLAFDKLYAQEMYPALVDVLLPDLMQGYRDDVVKFIFKVLNGEPLEGEAVKVEDADAAPAPAP